MCKPGVSLWLRLKEQTSPQCNGKSGYSPNPSRHHCLLLQQYRTDVLTVLCGHQHWLSRSGMTGHAHNPSHRRQDQSLHLSIAVHFEQMHCQRSLKPTLQ